jgi:hypothetical protein
MERVFGEPQDIVDVGGVMDYDYLSSIVSNYTNLSALSNKIGSVSGASSISDVVNTLSSGDTFSGLLNNALQSVSNNAPETSNEELIDSAIRAVTASSGLNSITGVLDSMVKTTGVDEDTAERLAGLAGVDTSNGTEKEARSNLIMQNYLTASIMKDTLQNSLTDSADFTQALFSGLAVGGTGDDGSSNSTLSTLQNSTLSAISNLGAYEDYLDKQVV